MHLKFGKKLEKDLGGRAEYWSYDYGTDELYVKVGDSVGKLRVKEQSPGARFIQTRIGENFVDPVGSDEKVDSLKAQGRFLTGVSSEESLFGPFPQKEPKIFDESKLPHNKDDGHDHDH